MSETKLNKKMILYAGGVVLLLVTVIVGINTISKKNTMNAEATAVAQAEHIIATEAAIPTNTLVVEPTIEPTLEPNPTATVEPTIKSTETAIPEISSDGVGIWAVSIASEIVEINMSDPFDTYDATYIGFMENETLNIQVPATNIVVDYQFNQPLPSGAKFQVYELNNGAPWFEQIFLVHENDGNSGRVITNHSYLINPPFWEITYHAKIVDGTGKVYWESDLRIYKALPNTCWDGSLPDPVTLYCKNFDGDWNYRDFPGFNPYADMFTSGQWEIDDEYYYVTPEG
ncbi:MAG: hypothetical protein JEZ00_09455 [Anaerolineaceae bacterium]|nr:hypothetical protein [Anaerolineaceae bacterium]